MLEKGSDGVTALVREERVAIGQLRLSFSCAQVERTHDVGLMMSSRQNALNGSVLGWCGPQKAWWSVEEQQRPEEPLVKYQKCSQYGNRTRSRMVCWLIRLVHIFSTYEIAAKPEAEAAPKVLGAWPETAFVELHVG